MNSPTVLRRQSLLHVCWLIIAAATACHSATGPDTTANIAAGAWLLQSVDGRVLPFVTEQTAAHTVVFHSDTLVINTNGTYRRASVVRDSSESGGSSWIVTTISPESGSYTQSGTALTFTSLGRLVVTGSLSSAGLTINRDGATHRYAPLSSAHSNSR